MRSFLFIALILSAVAGGTYWYQSTAYECPVPLSYRLGEIDQSFDLTESEAKEYAIQAETYWEDIARRELFTYDESSDFTIDFVFDERQALADKEENLQGQLDNKKEESERIRDIVEELQSEYRELSSSYQVKVDSYEARLQEYNQKVNQYNDRGGAPPEAFAELEKERLALSKESESLNKTALDLNDFASEINELGERGNNLVEDYNEDVNKYNEVFGTDREFTQGDYMGNSIRIYKFSTENELLAVLGHEFGHALGLGHVEDESSLMYYLLEDTSKEPRLSAEDIKAFYDICGPNETFEQRIRTLIRGLL